MAAIIFQLLAFILLVITIQTLVAADNLQEYKNYQKNDDASSRQLANFLNFLVSQPQWSYFVSSTDDDNPPIIQENDDNPPNIQENDDNPPIFQEYDDDDANDDNNDERDSRSFQPYAGQVTLCTTSLRQTSLSNDRFVYQPSIRNDYTCQKCEGQCPNDRQKVYYVQGNSCQTVYREKIFYRRQKHAARHCFKLEKINVADGCKYSFDHHRLPGKWHSD